MSCASIGDFIRDPKTYHGHLHCLGVGALIGYLAPRRCPRSEWTPPRQPSLSRNALALVNLDQTVLVQIIESDQNLEVRNLADSGTPPPAVEAPPNNQASISEIHLEAGTLKSTYALISEPLAKISRWHQQCHIQESGSPFLYLRITAEGRVIVGGEDEDFVKAKRRDALISRKARRLVKKFGRPFPDTPLAVAYAWAGTFGETKDRLAYIGVHPRFRHTYFALGYGGNGITFSLIAAEIIRDGFLGRKNCDAAIFRFGR